MKNLFLLSALGLVAGACQKKEVAPAADPTWLKLEIPTQYERDQVYAVTGDLDRTLLVSTTTGLYVTADQGKTWQRTRTVAEAVWGLLPRRDTIFALTSYRADSLNNKLTAVYADYFTADQGKTWAYTAPRYSYEEYRTIRQPFGQVSAGGNTYRVQDNWVPYGTGNSKVQRASDLVRTDAAGRQQVLRLPARTLLNNLSLDATNRLYVAASARQFDEATGEPTAVAAEKKNTAVLYVSRQPLP
ncbi:MAG: hypothetical protein EOO62_08270 [Hymenobacter sp.]|nr:MAG: hypothetical protein EOO62_08270 [Hymenobacter sp.]